MGLRDNAIVAYAETKVMEKSDRDVWVLSGEILEELLDKTGIDKNEIDGLVMAGLTGTGAANPFWAQTTADVLGLEVGFCEQVHTGGCSAAGCVARAAAAIDYGHVRGRVPAVRRHPRAGGPYRPQPLLSARMDRPLRPDGPARRLRPAQPAPTRRSTASTTGCSASSR